MILLAFLLASCAQSQPSVRNAITQTQSAWTPLPTQTPYPMYTLQPTIGITQIVTKTFTPSPIGTSMPSLPSSNITVDGGWGHITRDLTNAAFYMLIHNSGQGADRLTGASSEMCGRVGLQQMGNKYGADIPLVVNIPATSTVELMFGGYRLVCHDVTGGTGLGSLVPLTLIFENFGRVKVTIEIRNPPP